MSHPQHDYHIVDPSPWPVVASLSAFLLAFGAISFMHPDIYGQGEEMVAKLGTATLYPGLALLFFAAFMWWRNVIDEAQGGDHRPVVQLGLRYGMVLFITSEVMFFVAFFWAFFNASLFPPEAINFVWPPENITPFHTFGLPFTNTVILLLSGCTLTWAHHALLEDNRKGLIWGLAVTVVLGVLFTCFQAYEYAHALFGFKDGIYASTFYMATGFHGFHVIVGTIFLFVCLMRAIKGHFSPTQHFGLEAAAWYWHFVDVVWLFLFVSIYWWGGN